MTKTKHRFSDGAKERENMKKILVLSLLGVICFMPAQLLAACNSPVTLSFYGNQDPDDDEFLYTSLSAFNATKNGYINTGKKTSGSGRGYECDGVNSGGCGCDAVITLNKGHVFKGSVVKRKVRYQCTCGFDDYWKVVDDGMCSAPGFGEIEVGRWFSRELTAEECSGYQLTDVNGSKFKLLCRKGPRLICKAVKCKPGYILNSTAGTCTLNGVAQNTSGSSNPGKTTTPAKKTTTSTPAPAKTTSGGGTGGGSSGGGGHVGGGYRSGGGYSSGGGGSSSNTNSQNCTNSGGTWSKKQCSCSGDAHLTQSADKKTCECTAGYIRDAQKACVPTDETNCEELGTSVAKWENNQCICLDTRQIYSSVTKNCITNPEVTKCDKVAGAKWTDKCECIKQGYELKDGKCVKGAALVSSEQKDSRAKITSVYKKLNAMSGDFKVSVWKNADGNFNTARLASDSIAAVVLGTTGALVTSNIVKKNQVSGGFEDINCQVGGQTVAGWGDQFSVGIQ